MKFFSYLCGRFVNKTESYMKRKVILLGLLLAAMTQVEGRAADAQTGASASENLAKYVDPKIGTGDHGHVFMGANVPFGMVNAGPTQIETGWDWCSGYHESGKKIIGFGQMHLSGTGCGDLGDIGLMPAYGDVELTREGIASDYRHETEMAVPGYYRVLLDRFSIMAEVTATERTALYRFTFPRGSNNARIIIDLENTIGDEARDTRVIPVDDYTLMGYRRSHGWANDQIVYFCMRFNKPIHNWLSEGPDAKYGQATFEVNPDDQVMVKVALSPTSEANALINLNAEQGNAWDFDALANAASEAWNQQLSRIKATFRTERERTIFYTAMYHYMVAPQIWCDATGDYMGCDFKVHRGADYTTLTTWSLWDTYRAAHPLATIIMPDRMRDYAKTLKTLDDNVGRVLDELEAEGLLDNTLVVYTSDQGFYMGEHGWFDKRFMYEESLNTPLVMRLPKGYEAKGDITEMVQNIDYAPTFLDLAGAPIPADMDGVSLLPLLKGEHPKNWRKSIYYHFYEYPAEHAVKRHYGVRTERYKLIHFYNDIDAWELYDLQTDPHELHNIYGQPGTERLTKELRKELERLQKQYGDPIIEKN